VQSPARLSGVESSAGLSHYCGAMLASWMILVHFWSSELTISPKRSGVVLMASMPAFSSAVLRQPACLGRSQRASACMVCARMGQCDAPRLARAVADDCSSDQCHGELLQNLQIPLLFLAASRTVKFRLEEAWFWTTHAPKARLEIVDSAGQGLAFAKADDCARRALSFLLEQCR